MLTPIEALTPRSCAELATTLVLWSRNLTSDFASSRAPFSLPVLHANPLVEALEGHHLKLEIKSSYTVAGHGRQRSSMQGRARCVAMNEVWTLACLLCCIFYFFNELLFFPVNRQQLSFQVCKHQITSAEKFMLGHWQRTDSEYDTALKVMKGVSGLCRS